MKIKIDTPIKIIYKGLTDIDDYVDKILYDIESLKTSNIYRNCDDVICGYKDTMDVLYSTEGKNIDFDVWEHYYIVLEDGYVSKDLGSSGDSNARKELIEHIKNSCIDDSYIELDDIII